MSRDPLLYLEDMATACRRAIAYVEGMTFAQYLGDPKTRDAVARNLEILGEAAKRVPPELRAALPNLNWREACAFRDVLAHGYFGLDELILWEVVQQRAQGIADQIERFLGAPKSP